MTARLYTGIGTWKVTVKTTVLANSSENVLSAAGFAVVEVSTLFSIDTPQGTLKVLMGVGRKQVVPHL